MIPEPGKVIANLMASLCVLALLALASGSCAISCWFDAGFALLGALGFSTFTNIGISTKPKRYGHCGRCPHKLFFLRLGLSWPTPTQVPQQYLSAKMSHSQDSKPAQL
jgi:hypothetical protein